VGRKFSFVLAALVAAAGVACGLEVLGTYVAPDGVPDAATEDGPVQRADVGVGPTDAGDEGFEIVFDAQPIFDASLDVNPANCLAVCEAGTCNDAGACVFDCNGSGTACPTNQPVVCPPGVPCEVNCGAQGSCNRGVDCSQASRCTVACNGQSSCTDNPVRCSGDSCVVGCSGADSCDRGVVCDAGSCTLGCSGQSSCIGLPVECYGNSCTVQCVGSGACNRGVTCTTKDSCGIKCLGQSSCTDNPVRATATNVSVLCGGDNSCNRGVATAATDSGIICQNDNACGQNGVSCDGGRCQVQCDDTGSTPIKNCCKATTCVTPVTKNGCSFTTTGCPP